MASSTGTARGTMHGSCRPPMAISTGSPGSFTVRWGREMEAGGLMAQRTTSGAPFEMPPAIAPAWLVSA